MNASDLAANVNGVKEEFFDLMLEMRYLRKWSEVDPDTVRLYHRKKSVNEAQDDFAETTELYLRRENIPYIVSAAKDFIRKVGSKADKQLSESATVRKTLDRKVRECKRLLFFRGAVFVATQNDKSGTVFNSQTLIMLDVPSQETIDNGLPITMYAAPCGSPNPDRLYYSDPPSPDEVVNQWGWKKVKVGIAPENYVTSRHLLLYRQQYGLVPIGVSTVRYPFY